MSHRDIIMIETDIILNTSRLRLRRVTREDIPLVFSAARFAGFKNDLDKLGADSIEACHALWNVASERVLLKFGMTFVRYVREGFLKKGAWVEEHLLAITRPEWLVRGCRS